MAQNEQTLHVEGREFVTLPAGAYDATMIKVEKGSRSPYGVADASPDEQQPCFLWTFRIDEHQLPDDIQARIADPDDTLDISGTDQMLTTGVNFGSQRSTLTKMIRNLANDPKLSLADAKKINLLTLVGKRVLLVLEQTANQETGELRNKIASITPLKAGKK